MVEQTTSGVLQDVIVIHPEAHIDSRGRFQETYRRSWFPLGREMVQGSRSDKIAGSLVGLHYHLHQADYWYIVNGTAQVVLYDLRATSSTYDKLMDLEMGESNPVGVFIPPGVAHGFATLTDITLTYLVDGYYNPSDEHGIRWNDPRLDDIWRLSDPVVSERDQTNPLLADVPSHLLPYGTPRT
ncbi:MAG: dTDP-4-dehydrorhamnose 3,5-epimerase family protein [Ferrimicrobium sp.]|jgi:dTDP-4-dehydrorhamnose 3,5-epimerase|uniref:dTDP-4-dehydrorhamnose 3,5-epimerase family protein n=1 Tax=Ferrimicrobium acidiphilum TaxID=121039 RepID=A0ABV3Y0G1_9ACTN|nr:dTDP-4-dehydrorhamnose 3,5-epimerase family protein [Ferrimicrobium sp.]